MEAVLILENYNITCIKKTWADSVDIPDVNLFSGVDPATEETIDIKDYLIDMGELSYDFDEAEKENGENQLFYVSSDITFKLSGIENNDYLKTFFGLYTDTDRVKWHIKITPVGAYSAIWEGLVNHESITLPQSPDVDSDIISVTALSFEKEFKAYFQAQDLPATGIFGITGVFSRAINGLINPGFGGTGYQRRGTRIDRCFDVLFPGTNWTVESGIDEWYLIDNPVLAGKSGTYGTGKNYVFVKSSYERIRTNGENRYDFLRRICNSMGWVFYYYNGAFVIKNRSTDIPTLTELDVDEILSIDVSKYRETNTFDHVLILDGTIDGGDNTGGNRGDQEGQDMRPYQMRGTRFQLFSDANYNRITGGTWWQNMSGFLLNAFNIGDKFLRYFNETQDIFNLAFHTKTGGTNENPIWILDVQGVASSEMLRIDAGDTNNQMWLYDVTNGDNNPHSADATTPAPANQWTANRVRFKGCYGNALCKLSLSTGGYRITSTYEDYVQENLFFDNFQKFFSSRATRRINIKYNSLITNPVQVFEFINDTDGLYEGTWAINNMKINFIEETTDLELQRKNDAN